jgi:indole-3-glycerol phosphate synthase
VACSLPVIRKDFMIDPYQIVRPCAGCRLRTADRVGAGECSRWPNWQRPLKAFNLDVLVEVHDGDELERALKTLRHARWRSINNRNLHL